MVCSVASPAAVAAGVFCLLTMSTASNMENSTLDKGLAACGQDHCSDNLDIQMVLGDWQVKELYLHTGKGEFTNMFALCPNVSIWDAEKIPTTAFGQIMDHQQLNNTSLLKDRRLRLLWYEFTSVIEYEIFFKNESRGYWVAKNRFHGRES